MNNEMVVVNKEYIKDIINNFLEGSSIFITSVDIKHGNKIMVFLDGDNGVSINDCADISRHVEKLISGGDENFEIVISSHGITKPLSMPRQFIRHTGKMVTVLLKNGHKTEGIISEADEKYFFIQHQKDKNGMITEIIKFTYDEVKEVKLKIFFK